MKFKPIRKAVMIYSGRTTIRLTESTEITLEQLLLESQGVLNCAVWPECAVGWVNDTPTIGK